MKAISLGWMFPALLLTSGCLSSTAYGEAAIPVHREGVETPQLVHQNAEDPSANSSDSDNNTQPSNMLNSEPGIQPPIPANLAYAGRDWLFTSNDGGNSWQKLDFKANISDSTYISAATVDPNNAQHLVIGTTYYGLFESNDGGMTWTDMDPSVQFADLYQGAGFYNEVAALQFSPDSSNLFIRSGFDGPLLVLNMSTKSLRTLNDDENLEDYFDESSAAQQYQLEQIMLSDIRWPEFYPVPAISSDSAPLLGDFQRDSAWRQRRHSAENRYGFYVNSYQIGQNLERYVDLARSTGFNSVVIEFKDDQGILRYDSQLEIAAEAHTVIPRFQASEVLQRFHEAGIYVIARVVVFKDKALYPYENFRYALWDSRLNEPWGVYRQAESDSDNADPEWEQIEYWVDPYSEFVRNYNIQIAQELESLGVDEVQFDYIRFPSDGRVQDISTRFLLDEDGNQQHVDRNRQRVEILSQFLREARNSLSIPIGIDVFGFNGWARMSYLGQDIEVLSQYVDVISPMSYPSHYPRAFYGSRSYLDRAELIHSEGSRRAREIVDDRSLIRQYVQAFLIGGELNFDYPTYTEYLHRQVLGTEQGGGSGFSLWNNSGRYYMVDTDWMKNYIESLNNTEG